jgi:Relaxase/Mobilisation nuclease domain.
MHIKFLSHGTGSAGGAVSYLLGENDHLGLERAEVQVLRGNPQMVATVADNLNFVHRYSSGVVSWSPEEQPTGEEIDGVLDDVERAFTAGLDDPARVAWTAVLHREQNGACHVHLLAARVDLETGKSYNPAPPGWQKTFDPLRDAWNWERGWARPDDPLRARLYHPGHRALVEASALRAGLEIEEDPKALVTRYLVQRIEAGAIRNRGEMVESLLEAGLRVNRQGKDYLSIQDPDTGKKYRLKGAIYGADFTPETCRELGEQTERQDRAGRGRGGEIDAEEAGRARRQFNQTLERIAEYNHHRYRRPSEEAGKAISVDVDRQPTDGHGADLGDTVRTGAVRGMEAAPGQSSGSPGADHQGRDKETPTPVPGSSEQRAVVSSGTPDQLRPIDLHNRRRPKRRRNKASTLEEQTDDRVRDALSKSLGRLERAYGGFGEAIGDHDRELSGLVQEDAGFVGAVRDYGERAHSLDGAIRGHEGRSGAVRKATERLADAIERVVKRAVERAAELARKAARGLGSGLGR